MKTLIHKHTNAFALALAVLALAPLARAAVPEILPYAGHLEEDGAVYDGNATAVFSLYDDEVAGAQVWTETYASVPVVEGDFVVDLGANAGNPIGPSVLDGRVLWLEVAVNGQTLTPRTPVSAAPYAVRASVADALEGFDPGAYATRASLSTEGAAQVAWSNLAGVPTDLADGDADTRYSAGSGLTLTGTTFSLADGAVTAAKLAAGAVGSAQLADGSVTANDLANNAVTGGKIADGSVAAADLANDAVTSAKLADNAVGANHIVDGSVATSDLGSGAVTSAKLAANAVGASHIADGSVGANDLANGAVTSGKIAVGAVGAGQLAIGTVSTGHLASGAVTSEKLGVSAVETEHLGNRAVTSDKVAWGAIEAAHLKGSERMLYSAGPVCGYALLSGSQCRSHVCSTSGGVKFYTCAGACTATSPQLCSASPVGWMLALDN